MIIHCQLLLFIVNVGNCNYYIYIYVYIYIKHSMGLNIKAYFECGRGDVLVKPSNGKECTIKCDI